MSDSPLFPRAFVRGLNAELIRAGEVAYPTKEAADLAADYIADNSGMPDPSTQGPELTLKVAHELCVQLKQASDFLCKEAGGYSPELAKTAAAADPIKLASDDAVAIMQKVAYETERGEIGTEKSVSQSTTPEDKLTSGESMPASGKGPEIAGGETGGEKPVATGTSPENKMSSGEQASDTKGPSTDSSNPTGAVEEKGETSTTPEDKMTSGEKTAALQKTAALVVPFLLPTMTDREKVAHVNAMHDLSALAKAKYLEKMYQAYGYDAEKSAAEADKFRKVAEKDCGEDESVSKALEAAAAEMESMPSEDKKKEASALERLRTAAARIAAR
jgi:hypothetical protein